MSTVSLTQTYTRGAASAAKLDAAARDVLAELADPASEPSAMAAAAGLDRADLAGARIDVGESKQGLDPVLTPIVVGIAVSAGSKVAESLWKDVVWPLIKRKLGVDALGAATTPPEEH